MCKLRPKARGENVDDVRTVTTLSSRRRKASPTAHVRSGENPGLVAPDHEWDEKR